MTANVQRAGYFISLLVAVAALAFAPPTASMAQTPIQCQDGVDNDGDGFVDLLDPGCRDASDAFEATDSPYDIPVRIVPVAVPVVTIVGTVSKHGAVDIKRFRVESARGTVIKVVCRGNTCPFKSTRVTMKTRSQRLAKLERKLKPNLDLTMSAAVPGALGKYLKYRIRKDKAPKRTDSCVLNDRVRDCFSA